jgi:hypothetical protein
VFRLEGHYWTVVYGGTTSRYRSTRGFQFIGRLLRHPGRDVHVLDLSTDAAPSFVPWRAAAGDDVVLPLWQAGADDLAADHRARTSYRVRVTELQGQLAEAERNNDLGRCGPLREEIGALQDALAGAVRPSVSVAERARVNVRNGISAALRTIEQDNPQLSRHFRRTLRTGTFCTYDPDASVTWEL